MKRPKYPDLLELVRTKLNERDEAGQYRYRIQVLAEATGVLHDTILRIRSSSRHDPRYSTVHKLADHLLTKTT